jgi:heme oxygenase (biliverdin-IX-beta and delta-forming)
MDYQSTKHLAQLIRGQRWGCLATLKDGNPHASFVAYVPEVDFSALLIHVSRLAPHTQNLLADSRAAFAITEQDQGNGDPQILARVSIQGRALEVGRDTQDYPQSRNRYLQTLSTAGQLFTFSDFILFRLVPEQVRFVAGFAQVWDLDSEHFKNIAILK